MFSGIIENLGTIRATRESDGSVTMDIDTGFSDLSLGESVAINGICLTVVTFDAAGRAEFYASPETLQRTNLGVLRAGDRANLERAVSLATRLSGHIVQGHVDGVARLDSILSEAGAYIIELTLLENLAC